MISHVRKQCIVSEFWGTELYICRYICDTSHILKTCQVHKCYVCVYIGTQDVCVYVYVYIYVHSGFKQCHLNYIILLCHVLHLPSSVKVVLGSQYDCYYVSFSSSSDLAFSLFLVTVLEYMKVHDDY